MTVTVAAGPNSAGAQEESPLNFLQAMDQQPAALGGSASFTSSVIDLGRGAGPGFARWRVFVYSDQAGTVNLQQSSDGSTFYTTLQESYAGGQAAIYESMVALRYLQVSFINGAAAQTSFRLVITLVAI